MFSSLIESVREELIKRLATIIVAALITLIALVGGLVFTTLQNNPPSVFIAVLLSTSLCLLSVTRVYYLSLRREAKTFPKFTDTEVLMRHYMKTQFRLLRKGKDLHIRVIAVSMHYSWPFIRDRIHEYWKPDAKSGKLILELIITDSTWLKSHDFGEKWAERVAVPIRDLTELANQYCGRRAKNKLVIKLCKHAHLPSQHGLLINNKILLRSFYEIDTSSKPYTLTVGENPYELFRIWIENRSQEKISQFNKLFDYYWVSSGKNNRFIANDNINQLPNLSSPSSPLDESVAAHN